MFARRGDEERRDGLDLTSKVEDAICELCLGLEMVVTVVVRVKSDIVYCKMRLTRYVVCVSILFVDYLMLMCESRTSFLVRMQAFLWWLLVRVGYDHLTLDIQSPSTTRTFCNCEIQAFILDMNCDMLASHVRIYRLEMCPTYLSQIRCRLGLLLTESTLTLALCNVQYSCCWPWWMYMPPSTICVSM